MKIELIIHSYIEDKEIISKTIEFEPDNREGIKEIFDGVLDDLEEYYEENIGDQMTTEELMDDDSE